MRRVELLQQVDLSSLLFCTDFAIANIGNQSLDVRIVCIDERALIHRWQKGTAPVVRAGNRQPTGTKHDKAR